MFLKLVDINNAVYRCLDANPGGFRQYRGRDESDHRTMIVGTVKDKLIVESTRGYKGSRMNGPTNLRDTLDGISTGLTITAISKAENIVELTIQRLNKWAPAIPKDIKLFAPLLWGEIEDTNCDRVLLSKYDYIVPQFSSPYIDKQTLPSEIGSFITVTVELPVCDIPQGASLHYAHNNHAKPLMGSLPEGKHTVRIMFRPTPDTILISNPIIVSGKKNNANPANLTQLEKTPCYIPAQLTPPPAQKLPPIESELSGEIWFDSNREGNWDIFVMDANGSNVVNVTKTTDRGEFGPVPSPDGKLIAYHAGNPKVGDGGMWGRWNMDGKEIWVMNRDGSNPKKLAENAITPAWWHDRKSVLYGSKKMDCVFITYQQAR